MELSEKSPFAARDQELILRAALLEGADALDAWKEWANGVDLEGHLDNGTFDLLPLLYANLRRGGGEFPHMNILKGIYRQAWYKNQRSFQDASRILSSLHNGGIRTMVLNGLPLTIMHYKNFGARPMLGIDVLVRPSQVLPTADALQRAGWSTATTSVEDHMQHQHTLRFIHESGTELELRWYLVFRSCRADSDSDFWESALPVTIHAVRTYALNPTDMLFHIIVDGSRREPASPIRWIADAMTIIQSSHFEIDWPRIINHAKKHKVILQVRESLHYLYEQFQAKMPKTIMDGVKRIPVSSLEHFEYRYVICNYEANRETLLGGFPLYLIEYLRLTRDTGFLQAFAGFPKYLQYRLHERNLFHLVFSLIVRIMGTIKRKLAGSVGRKALKPDGRLSGRGNVFR